MVNRASRGGWTLVVCLALAVAGCGRKDEPAIATAETTATSSGAGAPEGAATATTAAETGDAARKLHQSFADATTKLPPESSGRPPDMTMTNKSVGKLYTEVVTHWDEIKYIDGGGKKLGYRAVLDTELGAITIQLLPDVAPNHVRSFVAMARASYYDGLLFERIVRQVAVDQPDTKIEYIEAGCPLGTGQIDQGSIGYWLKPEFSTQITHDPGVVGAVHNAEEDVSACKFYINLCKAPIMDGNFSVFGKITDGLDVAAKIMNAPVRENDPEYPDGDRPQKPVVIKKVTILVSNE